jgi:hypothetical protein
MSDIVERLRKNSAAQENGPYVGLKENRDCMAEAAAHIELLRSDLEMLCSGHGDCQWDEVQWAIYDEWHKTSTPDGDKT